MKFSRFFSCLLIFSFCIFNFVLGATPVMFPLKSFFYGANYTRGITITAVRPWLTDGNSIYAGSFITLTPAGGTNPIVELAPNDYTIALADVRTPLRFSVPDTNAVMNVLTLISNGLSSYSPVIIGSAPVAAGFGLVSTPAGTSNTLSVDPGLIPTNNQPVALAQLPSAVVTNTPNTSNWGDSVTADSTGLGYETRTPYNGSTLNERSFKNFSAALFRTNAIRMTFIGDSTATLDNGSLAWGVKAFFSKYLPVVSLSLSPYGFSYSANAKISGQDTNGYEYLAMPAGSYATNYLAWGNSVRVSVGAFPHGGTFNIRVITNGIGAGTIISTFSASNAATYTSFNTNIAVPYGLYSVAVDSVTCDTGFSNMLYFAVPEDNTTHSLILYTWGYGGMRVTNYTKVNTNISIPMFRSLSNDVLAVASKNSTGVDWDAALPAMTSLVTNGNPTADIIWQSALNLGDIAAFPDTDGCNRRFYSNAKSTGQYFGDFQSQLPSTNTLISAGWTGDARHLTQLGATIIGGWLAYDMFRSAAAYAWNNLGFFGSVMATSVTATNGFVSYSSQPNGIGFAAHLTTPGGVQTYLLGDDNQGHLFINIYRMPNNNTAIATYAGINFIPGNGATTNTGSFTASGVIASSTGFSGNAAALTNASPALAINSSTASDGMVTTKRGNNLSLEYPNAHMELSPFYGTMPDPGNTAQAGTQGESASPEYNSDTLYITTPATPITRLIRVPSWATNVTGSFGVAGSTAGVMTNSLRARSFDAGARVFGPTTEIVVNAGVTRTPVNFSYAFGAVTNKILYLQVAANTNGPTKFLIGPIILDFQ